jgi:choice-of-anchor B domain-containing protein
MNIHQLSFLNFDDLGYNPLPGDTAEGNDVWGWTDPVTGDEYAIMGLTGGTAFVRITDPVNPVPVGFMYTRTSASIWRDIKVIGNYAYIVSEARDHGLQVFDLTHLRGKDTLENYLPDATSDSFGNAHNIVSNEDTNFLYVVGATQRLGYEYCSGGLLVIDVSEPLNPTFVGCFGGDGYTHDAQCVIYNGPDAAYVGREICYCFNEEDLTIVDVTNKNAMTLISVTTYAGSQYTHQGWVTEDHSVILLDDELDENGQSAANQFTKTYWWDISDMANPQLVSTYEAAFRSIDHNQYIIGDYTYQSNYESGLRILHLDRQASQLSEVAYFDVFPSRTSAEFFGAWSVYPYFPSGNMVISSIDYGLFVVRADMSAITDLVQSKSGYAKQTRTRPLLSKAHEAACPALEETRFCPAPQLC